MSADRTEKATEQRKRKAREKGDSVRSRELNASFAMLAGVLMLGAVSGKFVSLWRDAYAGMLTGANGLPGTPDSILDLVRATSLPLLGLVALVMMASLGGALVAGVMQSGGIQFHAEALSIKPARLNPGSNLKQLASVRALVRLAKSLIPASIIAFLSFGIIRHALLPFPIMSLDRLPFAFSAGYSLALNAAWLLVAWAGVDYAMEYRAWNKRLRMTKQEVKEEVRDAMGNPQVKGKIRQIQRAMATQKRRADVSRASVLIMNPTHFAVALEFSFETMQAPKVLAKGRDLIALEMREQARWAGVPVIENPPLARSLYRSVKEGRAIPYELYAAVAGILAYLYREQVERAQRQARTAPGASA